MLTFQERCLRQYFREGPADVGEAEVELRTPAHDAHFTILTMCIDLLVCLARSDIDHQEESELRGYAVKYWHEHLNELDPDTASNEVVTGVLVSLHRIATNEDNVLNLFERRAWLSDIYPKGGEGQRPWYETLNSWAIKGASLPQDALEEDVRSWVSSVVEDPKFVLLQMAAAHVKNWLNEQDEYYIDQAYDFAKTTLSLVSTLPD